MDRTARFIELLDAVTVDCKDNGKEFVTDDRISVIERLLDGSAYKVVAREPLALVYARRDFCEKNGVVLVSSHVDSLHSSCFCNDEGDYLRGTFDNSFGNAAILWQMLAGTLPDNVVISFTGDEERDSQGAVQTVLALGKMQCRIKFAVVLDVTNVGWNTGACLTIENDNAVDMFTAYSIVGIIKDSAVKYAFEHDAEPDESWCYSEYGIPVFSFCIPAKGNLHADEGVLMRKESIEPYCGTLLDVLALLS
ncbi:MAG: M28 family peptidase [Bacteroidaceae bacterium]|nr:M28 family peptidase [Bacteroidaceae bacterium]